MRKIKFVLPVIVIIIFFFTATTVSAVESFDDDVEESLFSIIDSDTLEVLKSFGIDSLDYESIYNISFKNVFEYYKDIFSQLFTSSLKLFLKLLSLIVITGMTVMLVQDEKYKTLLSYLASAIAAVTVAEEINLCLSSALSLVDLCGKFILSFAPIYAIIIAVGGNPATALTYNTLVLSFAEGASGIINGVFVEFIGCYFCLSVSLSVSDTLNLNKLISVTNRIFSFVLGLVSSVFASFLTVRGVFSSSVDTVTAKGIRFAIGSLIPVIGSSISDAYSSLLGSINIIKSSVAVVGILAIIIMSVPVVTEIMFFNFSLSCLSFVSELIDCEKLSNTFRSFSCGVRIIGLISVFEVFLLIISTALILTVKGG